MSNQPVISNPEAMLWIITAIGVDLFGFIATIASPIPVIGQFLLILAPIIAISIFILFLIRLAFGKIKKGGDGLGLIKDLVWIIISIFIEITPFINALPSLSIFVIRSIAMDRFPILAKVIGTGGVVTKPTAPATTAAIARPMPPSPASQAPAAAPPTPAVRPVSASAPIASPTPSAQTPIPSGAPASAT